MESIIICGAQAMALPDFKTDESICELEVSGAKVAALLLPITEPSSFKPLKATWVLVEKIAFSCNYRDRAFFIACSKKNQLDPDGLAFQGIGSDFVARVVECGANVKTLQFGDLVIPDGAYPFPSPGLVAEGLPSNEASLRYEAFNEHKLLKIPKDFPIEMAAGLSVGGQTIEGMIRRLDIQANRNILITSATSNTSLFAINALKGHERLFVMSSNKKRYADLYAKGVKEIIAVDYQHPALFTDQQQVENIIYKYGKFDYVIDPFLTSHLFFTLPLMKHFGKTISCGSGLAHKSWKPEHVQLFYTMILNNNSIIGNCLGSRADLERMVTRVYNKEVKVDIDSCFSGNKLKAFFDRTYNAKNTFGKVIYKY